jgi:hypothetical protein
LFRIVAEQVGERIQFGTNPRQCRQIRLQVAALLGEQEAATRRLRVSHQHQHFSSHRLRFHRDRQGLIGGGEATVTHLGEHEQGDRYDHADQQRNRKPGMH